MMPNYVLLSLYSPICTVCGSALQHSPTIRPADARVVLLQCYTLVLYTIHTKPTTLFDGNDPLLLYLLMNKVPPFYYLKKNEEKKSRKSRKIEIILPTLMIRQCTTKFIRILNFFL